MEESNEKNKIFQELCEMYVKNKMEIKYQQEKGDRRKEFYFESIIKCIEDKLHTENKDSGEIMKLTAMKASLFYEHAKILIAIQENENLCLQLLRDALNLIDEYKLNCQITYLYYRILNLLAYSLSKLSRYEEAAKLLEQGELFYQILADKQNILVYNTDEFFENAHMHNGTNEIKFEKLITNNLQIQAWIYNKMSLSKKFLKYHHMVLNRQLETQDGSALLWFYKCARLGVYFFSNQKFVEGKHHLAAAFSVLQQYEAELVKHRFEPHYLSEWKNLKKYYADLGKYWTKYGLFLFNASSHLAVSRIKSEQTIHDILINSFQDTSSSDPAREWFNIKKNSMFFPGTKRDSETDKQTTKENSEDELNEHNKKESTTEITYAVENAEKPVELNLVNNIKQEITKLNGEVDDNVSEEITEVTKMIIDALDDRQKEVETSQNNVTENDSKDESIDDQKFIENFLLNSVNNGNKSESNIENKPKHNFDDQTQIQSETNVCNKQKDSESINFLKEIENYFSKNSSASDTQSSSSNMEDDKPYEFKFPSLDLSQYPFKNISTSLIDSTENARELFCSIKEWVKYSKAYYTIQDHPKEYIQIILDLNELYCFLSQYETDIENQYEVQRKRVGILEALSNILKEIRPQEYLFISIELLQELIQTQIELLMINIRRLTNVKSCGNLLLKDICQEHNDATRKIEALTEIQRRLGRRDARLSLIDLQLFG